MRFFKKTLRIQVLCPVIIALIVAVAQHDLSAADKNLNLEQTVALGLEQNPQVLIAREALFEFAQYYREARADALPALTLNASALRYRDPSVLNSDAFEDFQDMPGFEFSIDPQNLYQTTLGLSQTLFSWGRVGNAIEAAKIQKRRVSHQLNRTEHETALSITRAYLSVGLAEETLRVNKAVLARQEEFYSKTQKSYELGAATRLELLSARTALESMKPELIAARNSVSLTQANLNALLSLPLETTWETAPVELDTTESHLQLNFCDCRKFAFENRPELKDQELILALLELDRAVKKSVLRPSVYLNSEYGYVAADETNLGDPDYRSWSAAINMSFPLFNGFRTSGRVKQVESRYRQQELGINRLKDGIELEVKTAIDERIKSDQSVEAARTAVRTAREARRIADEMFNLGAATYLEVLEAIRGERSAELGYAKAMFDLQLATAELAVALGLGPLESLDTAAFPQKISNEENNLNESEK